MGEGHARPPRCRRGRASRVVMRAMRAGKVAITARRVSGVMAIHDPISWPVRPQPMQKPLTGSMTQTWTQGDSMDMGVR